MQKVEIPDLNFGGGGGSPAPSNPAPEPSSPAPSSPAPSSSPTPEPSTPAPPPCDKTFAQVAGETSGLGLLSTVLAQDAYASALPDPAYPYTLFAPTDAAFFDLLSTFSECCCCLAGNSHASAACMPASAAAAAAPSKLTWFARCGSSLDYDILLPLPADLSITDALALGDKLNAVLLYHVVPGALTPDQLAQCERLLVLLLAWLLPLSRRW